ncbi:hypothetical protein GSH19_04655 [Lactobacillus sp. S2-2]|uniref:hypothetical protein n=1 Tax=Lactobacillus sp. S2-2 TaxID=2692917 RepID=UPI001F44BAC3|nr:hypothetical protein [Lactobacillus sp. S2-2]MCF6515442.1 hypothetical protein [Lactobacillus sp. S2-2]
MENIQNTNCENDCMKFINSNNSEDEISIQVSDIVSALKNQYSIDQIYRSLNNLRKKEFIDGGIEMSKDEMGNPVTNISPILIIE